MRRFLLLFAVLCFAGLGTANAQCTKGKKACAKKSVQATSNDAETFAMNAALEDETVERKVCSKSGNVSYHQSSTCAKSGAVSVNEVQWCTKSNKFVNVSPSEGMAKPACSKGAKASCSKSAGAKACCAGGAKAACCAKKGGASAVKASNTSAKTSCAKKCSKGAKACSKTKATSASAEVKAVKVSNEG